MKLHKLFTLIIVAAMLLALAPAASAQTMPTGNWVSGIACQNLDEINAAAITLEFYDQDDTDGIPAVTFNDSIPANSSKNYYTPTAFSNGIPTDFLGSVMIQSSAPLACNVNTENDGTGTSANPRRAGTSAGFGDAGTSTIMYAPQVMREYYGWGSYIAVQNATDAEIEVTVSYKNKSGVAMTTATETVNIPGYANHVFSQIDNADLGSNFVGAATIEGTGAIAVTVNFFNDAETTGETQLQSYNGFAAGDTTLLVPRLVRRYYGYNSGISIQNIGSAVTTVTMTFTFKGGTYTATTDPIQPGAAWSKYITDIVELLPVDSAATKDRFGSAVFTSSGSDIIAIINEDNRGEAASNDGVPVPYPTRIGQGSTYNAFLSGAETNTVFFSQIVDLSATTYLITGGFQVMNATGTAAKCDATFTNTADPVTGMTNVDLPANGSWAVYAPNVAGLGNYNGAVIVECTQPIVGISNMSYAYDSGLLGDSSTAANGLNK